MSAGYRGLLAPWVGGGAGVPHAPPATVGFRSLLAVWIGGAGVATETTQPPQQQTGGAFGFRSFEPRSRKTQGAAAHEALEALRRARERTDEIQPLEPQIGSGATDVSTRTQEAPTAPPIKPADTIQALQAEPSAVQTIAAQLATTRDALAAHAADLETQAATERARSNRNRIAILLALLLLD